jgi:hypothetical protein
MTARQFTTCIFCLKDSSSSCSVEHINPESLGNTDHVLPAGLVCDPCNNYFATKVEGPLLDSCYFRDLRLRRLIPNKRGRMPLVEGIHLESLTQIGLGVDSSGAGFFGCTRQRMEAGWVRSVRSSTEGTMIFPKPDRAPECLMARMLSKIALEVLASHCCSDPAAMCDIYENQSLAALRAYSRRGEGCGTWPYSERRIYPADTEIIHEYMLLDTPHGEFYLVLALFGVEYALNLGDPKLDGYMAWLENHGFGSPLYMPNATEDAATGGRA